jgi:hypothetical protein
LILFFQTIVAVVLNHCRITGATNFKKCSNNTKASLNGDKQFTIGSDIELTNLRINVNFDAKLGIPRRRLHPMQKTACIEVDKSVFYFEFVVNARKKSIKVNKVELISNERVKCKSNGFIWPFDRIVNTLVRKNIEKIINDNQPLLKGMLKSFAGEFCSPYYSELNKNEEFKKIIKRINF